MPLQSLAQLNVALRQDLSPMQLLQASRWSWLLLLSFALSAHLLAQPSTS